VNIVYDSDLSDELKPSVEEVIKESITEPCSCGCDEIYVSIQDGNKIDVKCYDCGTSYFELEVEIEEEEIAT